MFIGHHISFYYYHNNKYRDEMRVQKMTDNAGLRLPVQLVKGLQ